MIVLFRENSQISYAHGKYLTLRNGIVIIPPLHNICFSLDYIKRYL